jgi:predicted double-glycine peptidase
VPEKLVEEDRVTYADIAEVIAQRDAQQGAESQTEECNGGEGESM